MLFLGLLKRGSFLAGVVLAVSAPAADMLLIDDFKAKDGMSRLGTPWRLVTDRVMGGVSAGRIWLKEVDGRPALCMHGDVSLENNGGFIQATLDLAPAGYLDASRYSGVRIVVQGNGESYNLHLKTADVGLPWQSYRRAFPTVSHWQEIRLPFDGFEPHRIDVPLDTASLSRLGLLAIGRVFTAELCVAEVGLY